jgi:hypothetical protein
VSEAEHPQRKRPEHRVTVEDIRQLSGASAPHFSLHLRNRIARLTQGLDADDPVRIEGEREIRRLTALAVSGEVRGTPAESGLAPLPSNRLGVERTRGE